MMAPSTLLFHISLPDFPSKFYTYDWFASYKQNSMRNEKFSIKGFQDSLGSQELQIRTAKLGVRRICCERRDFVK